MPALGELCEMYKIKRRRAATIAGLLLFIASCRLSHLQAQTGNNQKIIPIDSEIYKTVQFLYISQGLVLPSTAGPNSQDELLSMLNRLDYKKLKLEYMLIYDFAENQLKTGRRNVEFNGAVTVQAFAHTNTENFISQDLYIRHPNLISPLVNFSFDLFFKKNGYLYFELPIMETIFKELAASPQKDVNIVQSANLGTHPFGINTLYSDGLDVNGAYPFRTFVGVGGEGWNVQFGRDRLSWGPGESGNFLVGSHVHYHTGLRAAFYGSNLKYMYNISDFPYPGEYYVLDDENISAWIPAHTSSEKTGINLFIAHRLEWNTLGGKLQLALNEAVIYQSKSGSASLDTFVPSMILHNLFRSSNQNSIFTAEAVFSPMPSLNLYAQFALDEFALPNESKPEENDAASPNSLAFMFGARTAFVLFKGVFSAYLEYVQTDPYLYLHRVYEGGPLAFIVSNRYTDLSGRPLYAEEFLGYRWGGDAQVINLNAEYRRLGAWNVGVNLLFMMHGTHDKWSGFSSVYPKGSNNYPEDLVITNNHRNLVNYADKTAEDTRNSLYYFTALSFKGSLQFLKKFSVFGQLDFIFINNFGNIAGRNEHDVQCTVSLTYSF